MFFFSYLPQINREREKKHVLNHRGRDAIFYYILRE